VEQLIALIALDGGIIAERASAYLAGNLPDFQANHAPEVVRLLDHPNDAVRHNILVALIPLVGLAHIRPFIDDAVNSGLISPAARLAAEQKLAHVAGLSPDGMVDMALLDLGILETPLLSYLPNLDVGGA
jgi:hypothetical protein